MNGLRRTAISLLSSLFGFFAGSAVFPLWALWVGRRYPRPIGAVFSSFAIWYVVIAALSFVGWLVFLLPFALRFRRGTWRDHAGFALLVASLTAMLLVTVAYVLLFHGQQYAVRASWIYEIAAVVDAASATALCLFLLRRERRSASA